MKQAVTWLLIICLVPWFTGCAEPGGQSITGRLYSSDLAANHNGPSDSPNLRISRSEERKDFLVEYDEQRDSDARIDHRAYWLYASQPRIEKGKRPHFVDPAKAGALMPVSVESTAVTNSIVFSSAPAGAVLLADHRHFTLVFDREDLGQFTLPSYPDPVSRAKVAALAPFAAAGDVTLDVGMIAGVAAVIAWWGLATCGATIR